MYGQSKNGWITSELFDDWFQSHFLPHAPQARPILLLMDGHSTHYCPQVINKALESKVILFCLPPNTTHLTQPLDKGCFSPLKMSWRKKCQSFLDRHPGRVVTKYEFSRLFGEAWLESMSMSNVIAGFRCTGIFPLDRAALLPTLSAPHATTLSERYGVNFIPTYSPARRKQPTLSNSGTSSNTESGDDEGSHPSTLQYRSCITQSISKVPQPTLCKNPVPNTEGRCGRILTSAEYLHQEEEKKRKKREEECAKEQRKKERERKRHEKQVGKAKRCHSGKQTVSSLIYSLFIVDPVKPFTASSQVS